MDSIRVHMNDKYYTHSDLALFSQIIKITGIDPENKATVHCAINY